MSARWALRQAAAATCCRRGAPARPAERVLGAVFDDEFLSPVRAAVALARHRDQPFPVALGRRRRRSSTSPPSRRPACSAATPTGAAGLVPGQLPVHRGAARWAGSATRSRSSTRPAPGGGSLRRSPRPRPSGWSRSGSPTRRPPPGVRRTRPLQTDPAWRDLAFHEYFHGDTGGARRLASDRLDGPRGPPLVGGDAGHPGHGRRTPAPAAAGPSVPGGEAGVM